MPPDRDRLISARTRYELRQAYLRVLEAQRREVDKMIQKATIELADLHELIVTIEDEERANEDLQAG